MQFLTRRERVAAYFVAGLAFLYLQVRRAHADVRRQSRSCFFPGQRSWAARAERKPSTAHKEAVMPTQKGQVQWANLPNIYPTT